MKFKQK